MVSALTFLVSRLQLSTLSSENTWVNFIEKNYFPIYIQHQSQTTTISTPRGVLRISSDGNDRMGMKIRQNSHRRSKASKKNQPIPGPQITTPSPPKKIYSHACYSQSSEPGICGHCHEFQIALNQANQKTPDKFSYPIWPS